ncbi:phospholipase [beta proteobacterium AAP121]|nr:phospholipase [beta proteobacterium AAP65]KPF99973.1 phospholipase [beta proteobacterium AAP121]
MPQQQALAVHAGSKAREHLRQHGLRPADVRVVPAAAGGPKGLSLIPLDRYLFGEWFAGSTHSLHLLGASIGAWRMAAACTADPDVALAQLAEDYITQTYPSEPGKPPTARVVTEVFRAKLDERLGTQAATLLAHPQRRLHVFTSRGRRLLHRPGRVKMPLGWMAAFAANAASRSALGGWMERVVFSDPREPLPVPLADYPTRQVPLTAANLMPAVLASCTIPFWLEAVQDVPGGPAGTYFDGGITDYHLHLGYAGMGEGLVLYPHFGAQVVPGWLDKAWKRRHRASPALDNLVLLSPKPEWVRRLPGGKLPDRSDFKRYGQDPASRQRLWRQALAESQRLADEFAELVRDGRPVEALPLR